MSITDLLIATPWVAVLCALILGLLVGSFLNVVVYRLPVMLQRSWSAQARELLGQPPAPAQPPFNLMVPPSRCPHCQNLIHPWENIPIVSWLCLRGKCSTCKAPISPRYPLVELASGLLSAWLMAHFGFGWQACTMIVLTWGLLAAALIDADHQLLPDVLVLPLLWLGLICNCYGLFTSLSDALWGAVAGYLSLWLVYWGFKLVTGKEGMGGGDFKLLAAIGAWGGWQVLPVTIILSSVVGAIIGALLLQLRRDQRSTAFAFGPFLAIAGWLALIWGKALNQAYLQLLAIN